MSFNMIYVVHCQLNFKRVSIEYVILTFIFMADPIQCHYKILCTEEYMENGTVRSIVKEFYSYALLCTQNLPWATISLNDTETHVCFYF